jgi:hypothetical protein
MDTTPVDEQIPEPGQWPVDPQEDLPISEDRIWVDGCFDFSHHGKAIGFCFLKKRQGELTLMKDMRGLCFRLVNSARHYTWGFTRTKRSWKIRAQRSCRWMSGL